MAADHELDHTVPPCLHLVSAFLAMESTDSLIFHARVCGGGSITGRVQRFIWDHFISKAVEICTAPYFKIFLKKLINEIESNHGEVLDELYEQYAYYMTSLKDNNLVGNSMIRKCISFIFPNDCFKLPSCPSSMKLVVPLQCSLNMLGGDTGCSVWPSSLFLSEFILSCPEIFSNKSCFEVGSGVGLVGICLAHVKASKFVASLVMKNINAMMQVQRSLLYTLQVILSDGDLSTLTNMKLNLELNQLSIKSDFPERTTQDSTVVNCIHLPWESAPKSGLQDFMPDIVLGADVIYDPLCLPHLIRVLAVLLDRTKTSSYQQNGCLGSLSGNSYIADGKVEGADEIYDLDRRKISQNHNLDSFDSNANGGSHGFDACQAQGKAIHNDAPRAEFLCQASKERPVAYIASVIRNIDTFNHFLELADQANLIITDLTETFIPFDLLPYMQSYNRPSIRLFSVSYLCS